MLILSPTYTEQGKRMSILSSTYTEQGKRMSILSHNNIMQVNTKTTFRFTGILNNEIMYTVCLTRCKG